MRDKVLINHSFLDNSVCIEGCASGYKPKYVVVNRVSFEIDVYEGEGDLPLNLGALNLGNISELLQLSYIIPPNTVYRDVYVVNIGDRLIFSKVGNDIDLKYEHKFPFMECYREPKEINNIDFLESLYGSISRQSIKGNSFLFHTAGKDSNTVLASYLQAGCKSELTLISGASEGNSDESAISKSIAKKHGLPHVILPILNKLNEEKLDYIKQKLALQPFPNVDPIMLPLSLYGYNGFDFSESNCVFGDGNDGYFFSLPSMLEKYLSPITNRLFPLREKTLPISSSSKIASLLRSKLEWSGVYGLTYYDLNKMLVEPINIHARIVVDEIYRRGFNDLEAKSDAYSTRAISQRMMQKLALFCSSNNANLVLPFADKGLISEWGYLHASQLTDANEGLNKTFLRDIVKDVVGLDTTKIGKKGWSFNYVNFVDENKIIIIREISHCYFWEKGVVEWVSQMYGVRDGLLSSKIYASRAIYMIFMVTLWLSSRG